jgi:hypothetical protein
MFVNDVKSLASSVARFMDAPEYWRASVGGMPKYFIHVRENGKDLFGLSKFSAFQNISPVDYVTSCRHNTNGGTTQKHVSKVAGKPWIPLAQVSPNIRKAFKKWFLSFFPSTYDLRNISCITLGSMAGDIDRSKNISPKNLAKKLKEQAETGRIGEKIAVKYEINRLSKAGVVSPEKYVVHVAKQNCGAGFDIFSDPPRKERRYIEVKTSNNKMGIIYLTAHEVETLRKHKDEAFLYMVSLDLSARHSVREIKNPIPYIEKASMISPIAFRAEVPAPSMIVKNSDGVQSYPKARILRKNRAG